MRKTSAYQRIAAMSGRYRICQGGMRAGKTFAILQYLIAVAEIRHNYVISVVSSTLPTLRLGAIRDFEAILHATGHIIYFTPNRSTFSWRCNATGSVIEFFGLDGKDGELKARGPARDVLFINEANRMRWDTFEQLAMRTSGFIYLDFNPSSRFWAHDLAERDDATLEIFTYLDNEEIPPTIKADIESHDRTSNWWRVYGAGQIGELEGNVFSKWQFRHMSGLQCELIGYGLDFGFRPDPCAMVALHRTDDTLVLEEVFEETGLMSAQIIDRVRKYTEQDALIVCDNARPEIIAEMRQAGLMAVPCIKQEVVGKDKIGKLGQIERMAEQDFIAMGENLEREYLTYAYEQDKTGNFMPVIKDGNDHLIDAARYIWYWHYRADAIEAAVNAGLKEYGLE